MTASEMGKLGAAARIRNTTRQQREAWARKAGKASGKARKAKQYQSLIERTNEATSQTN